MPDARRRKAGGVLCVALAFLVAMTACGGGGHKASRSRSRSTAVSSAPRASATVPSANCSVPATTPPGGTGQSTYVSGAAFPTALAWAPDGRLFFAERGGTIKIATGNDVTTFATVSTVTTEGSGGYSERGLLGLALSPTSATDHFVYAMYSSADHEHQLISRWNECKGAASNETQLVSLPAGSDCCHKGGRLAFGPDGKLYATLGDEHSVPAPPGGPNPPVPQDTSDPRGKILRYNPDGTIPSDNPFGPTSPVWAAGLRNPFGLAFGADGTLFVTSNGPTGDAGSPSTGYDLVLTIKPGGIYQWPYCYGYSHRIDPYSSCMNRPEPDWSSESDTVVPTGATYVDNRGPAQFAGHFVFCNNSAGMRVFTGGTPRAELTNGPDRCRLDVKQGPDHALYFSDESNIYRLR